jgi:hypothetical protein
MEKDLNKHREDLINVNEKIKAIAKFMALVEPSELQDGKLTIFCDLGYILEKESRDIQDIIGSYDEFLKAEKATKGKEQP